MVAGTHSEQPVDSKVLATMVASVSNVLVVVLTDSVGCLEVLAGIVQGLLVSRR